MRTSSVTAVIMAVGILTNVFYVFADSSAVVPYPVNYRKWTVTKSFVAGPESKVAGFHHYYANDKALGGFATGKFPDGSVIVDERVEVEQRGGSSFEGKRLSIGVMVKNSRTYAETGGWGFDGTVGDSQTLDAPAEKRAACFSCHSQQENHDFVFSTIRK
jgi:hypothetical protein